MQGGAKSGRTGGSSPIGCAASARTEEFDRTWRSFVVAIKDLDEEFIVLEGEAVDTFLGSVLVAA